MTPGDTSRGCPASEGEALKMLVSQQKSFTGRKVMERRNLWAGGLMAVASSLLLMAGTASAHGTVLPQAQTSEAANCVIHTLPGLMRQGEFKQVGDVGDIVTIECDPKVFPGGTQVEVSDAQLYSRCSLTGGTISWVNPNEFSTGQTRSELG